MDIHKELLEAKEQLQELMFKIKKLELESDKKEKEKEKRKTDKILEKINDLFEINNAPKAVVELNNISEHIYNQFQKYNAPNYELEIKKNINLSTYSKSYDNQLTPSKLVGSIPLIFVILYQIPKSENKIQQRWKELQNFYKKIGFKSVCTRFYELQNLKLATIKKDNPVVLKPIHFEKPYFHIDGDLLKFENRTELYDPNIKNINKVKKLNWRRA